MQILELLRSVLQIRITLMRLRILLFPLMRIHILPFTVMRARVLRTLQFDADPDPTTHFFPVLYPPMFQAL
jgi:hypothetical protein